MKRKGKKGKVRQNNVKEMKTKIKEINKQRNLKYEKNQLFM